MGRPLAAGLLAALLSASAAAHRITQPQDTLEGAAGDPLARGGQLHVNEPVAQRTPTDDIVVSARGEGRPWPDSLTIVNELEKGNFSLMEAEANASDVTLEELMTGFFPQLPGMTVRQSGACGSGPAYPDQHFSTESNAGWVMALLHPGCFERIRGVFGTAEGFADAIADFRAIGSGSGISGAQHFLSGDGRFYMKSIPESEVGLLESGAYLQDLVEYSEKNPSTLMVQMMAVVRFRYSGTWSSDSRWLLIMDNYKRGVKFGTDSFVEFDMKASKWKHRIQKKGGRRCSPMFPLEFWKSGAGNPHVFEGEDLDFYALRTQTNRAWLEDTKAKKAAAPAGSFRRKFLRREIESLPAYDDCMGGEYATQWLKHKAGDDLDFCGALNGLMGNLSEERAANEIPNYSAADVQALRGAWAKAKLPCESFVYYGSTGFEADWKAFLHQEKAAIDSVRDFFGYAAPSIDLTQKPMVMEPCTREALVAQLAKDTAFLSKHGIMDYSMGLVIKHQEADPEEGACRAATAAWQQDRPSETGSGSVFERYQGGIRAVSARPAEAPERAVFTFKIVDTLTEWHSGKWFSAWAQSLVGENKVESLLPLGFEELASSLAGHRVGKCKDLGVRSARSSSGLLCWSGCDRRPSCSEFGSKLVNERTEQWNPLADYTFQGDWVEDRNSDLHCNGWSNSDGYGRRALCAVTKAGPSIEDFKKLKGLPEQLNTVPEPFRTVMNDAAIEKALNRREVKALLDGTLELRVRQAAPMVLKRLAVAAYYDFARRPIGEDTVPAEEYAERFLRFMSAWTDAPEPEEWSEMCPEAAEAGCKSGR